MLMRPRPPHRRRFLAFFGAMGAAAASVAFQRANPRQNACEPTAADAMGPFYISEMPVLTNLNRWGKPGEVMEVTGQIWDAVDPARAVSDARLEVWQTDGQGVYHPQANGVASDYADDRLDLRGTILADADGGFSFRTLIPGTYAPRPRHIHYRITAVGYRPLVTQHYLADGEPDHGVPCRSGHVDRSGMLARFDAPPFYLSPAPATA